MRCPINMPLTTSMKENVMDTNKCKNETNVKGGRMLLFKRLFRIISFLLCIVFISNAGAIMIVIPLPWKVDESALIIIGTVGDQKLLSSYKKERIKTDDNIYIAPELTFEGLLLQVKVEEVLLDRRETNEKADQKLSKVTVFLSYPTSDISPILTKGEKHLMFLQKANIDPVTVEKHKLDKKEIYEAVFARAGVYGLSGKGIRSKRLRRNLQYLQTSKDFIGIKKIESKTELLKRWQELLKSDNETLKSSALVEIERIKDPKRYKMRREARRKNWESYRKRSKRRD